MKKQILAITLAAAMLLGVGTQGVLAADFTATATVYQSSGAGCNTYFRDQLGARPRRLYNAIEKLRQTGGLLTGTGSIGLIRGGCLNASGVKTFLNGDDSLVTDFQQARDAYVYDHPELFYIDLTKLTLRCGRKGNSISVEIGCGANENYYIDGFSSRKEVEAAIAQTEQEVDATAASATGTPAEQFKAVHNAIVNRTEYKTEGEAGEDADYVRGAYGALVRGKALCEGYARTMKTVLDQLGIPSVLVSGVAENSIGLKSAQMWNQVQIDGEWFAVDATWDDPVGGSPRELYLLNGATAFTQNHTADGTISPAGKAFTYPSLFDANYFDLADQAAGDESGLVIDAVDKTDSDGDNYTQYTYSYNGMSLKQIMKQGLFVATRLSADGENWFAWSDLDFYYGNDRSQVELWYDGYVQFAVTDKPMDGMFSYTFDLSEEGNNVALSEPYRITESLGNSHYVAPPFVIDSTPSVQAAIRPGTMKVSITFNENLVKTGELGIDVSTSQNYLNYSVSNIKWTNGSEDVKLGDIEYTRQISTVTFDFTTDATYNTHNAVYSFQVKGLEGEASHKEPNAFRYLSKLQSSGCSLSNRLFSGASPRLVADDVMSSYQPDEQHPADSNILLVASKNGQSQTFALNLDCTELGAMAATLGHVTLAVPYPAGYDVNHDGSDITFSAYRMEQQADGSYQAAAANCVITAKGLEVRVVR